MKVQSINIDFKKIAIAFRAHVRLKALKAGSTIVYVQDGNLIEENPKDSSKQIKSKVIIASN
jgi:phage gp45-like